MSYSLEKTDEVVYRYLFEGLSTRDLDCIVLEKDSSKSGGWQSHGILKHYGLSTEFKNLFKDMSPEEAMSLIPDNDPACVLIDVIGRHSEIYTTNEPRVTSGVYEIDVQPGKERLVSRCIRANQYQFRNAVMEVYDGTCCITDMKNQKLLVASHIKPWSRSSPIQKTDPCNGLCLNRIHDAAFDTGLMTVDADTFRVRYSSEIEDTMPENVFDSFFKSYEEERIRMPICGFEPSWEYLEYHNREVFEKDGCATNVESKSLVEEDCQFYPYNVL